MTKYIAFMLMLLSPAICFAEAGVPLGGIGTGKLEIRPDGSFGGITLNNNPNRPIPEMNGTFLSIYVENGERKTTRILSSADMGLDIPPLKPEFIQHKGLWPRARFHYDDPALLVNVALEAFGSVIPRDHKRSCLPLAFFDFEVHNPSTAPVDVSIAFTWENVNGLPEPNTNRYAMQLITASLSKGIKYSYDGKALPSDYWGDYTLMAEHEGGGEITVRQWNMEAGRADFVRDWQGDGMLSNELPNEPGQFLGTIALKKTLASGGTKHFRFVLAWNTPRFYGSGQVDMGHYYSNFYTCSEDMAQYGLENFERIQRDVHAWQERVLRSNLPEWFEEMLLNYLYPLSATTCWTRDGRYAILEAPVSGPMYGTLDQLYTASMATLLFFPELEHSQMKMFADRQLKNGQFPHDLGSMRLDGGPGRDGKYRWTDLQPKFIILAYRNFRWTGDSEKFRYFLPHIRKALRRMKEQDTDGDYLPNQRGVSSTYDTWGFSGTNAYCADVTLCAYRVAIEIARYIGDSDMETECRIALETGSKYFEENLWMENVAGKGRDYYIFCREGDKIDDVCANGQLGGLWMAEFLHLGKLGHPQTRIDRALQSIHELCARGYTIYKGMYPEGSLRNLAEPGGWHYPLAHYCGLLFSNGKADTAMEDLKRKWDAHFAPARNGVKPVSIWNQPLTIGEHGERVVWGDRYMSSPGVWASLIALLGFDIDVTSKRMWIMPNLPSIFNGKLVAAPIPYSKCWGQLDYSENAADGAQNIEIRFDQPMNFTEIIVRKPVRADSTVVVTQGGRAVPVTHEIVDKQIIISFSEGVTIDKDGIIIKVGQGGKGARGQGG